MKNSYDIQRKVWGKDWDFNLTFDKSEGITEGCDKHIKWIDQNKDKFVDELIKDGIIELANDWNRNNSLITKDNFVNYLSKGGANVYIKNETYSFDIFLSTEPDLFAYHSIEVFLDVNECGEYKINVNGLAG